MKTTKPRWSWTLGKNGAVLRFRRNVSEFAGGSEMGEMVPFGFVTVERANGRKSTFRVFSWDDVEELAEQFRAGELNN